MTLKLLLGMVFNDLKIFKALNFTKLKRIKYFLRNYEKEP